MNPPSQRRSLRHFHSKPAGATVAFVHQHEIVLLEGVHRDGLVAHLFAELVDVDDLYGLIAEQSVAGRALREQLGPQARFLELGGVLQRQPLVGREKYDPVEVVGLGHACSGNGGTAGR